MDASFDLHVLGTPPAFILSQDQTLNKMVFQEPKFFKSISLMLNLSFNSQSYLMSICDRLKALFFGAYLHKLFLHCLIYKVHAAESAELYLNTLQRICRELFSSFLNFFVLGSSPQLYYVTTTQPLCQDLF